MPWCNNDKEDTLTQKDKELIATYNNIADMVRIGAYKKGANEEVDEAIKYYVKLLIYFLKM